MGIKLLVGAILFLAVNCCAVETLYQAISDGDLASVKTILKANPAAVRSRFLRLPNISPLRLAAGRGKPAIVKLLLDSGADVNEPVADVRFNPVLHVAVHVGDVESAKLLLKAGADVNLAVKSGSEILTALSEARTREMAALLLEAGAKVNDGRALYRVISANAFEDCPEDVAVLLLEKGADPNGHEVMWAAACGRSAKLMKLLLEKGGSPPLGVAGKAKNPPLVGASSPEQFEVAKLLIEHGADVNALGDEERTLLHKAAHVGNDRLIELLLEKGAKIDASRKDGARPIHEAIFYRQTKSAELLASKGAKLDLAAHVALNRTDDLKKAMSSDPRLARAFFSGETSELHLTQKPSSGPTLLQLAALHGRAESAEILLSAGADIEAQVVWSTPLYLAAERGSRKVVELLLVHGAKVDVRTFHNVGLRQCIHGEYFCDWRTPLLSAAAAGNAYSPYAVGKPGVLRKRGSQLRSPWPAVPYSIEYDAALSLLIAAGADVNAKDGDGRTVLDLAREAGHQSAIELLLKAGSK